MTERTRTAAARALAAAGLTGGVVLLIRPQWVLDALAPAFPRERRWLARLLGARLVAQHGALLVRPEEPAVLAAAAGLELLHAASMLPFAGTGRYGRAARISGAVALASAALIRLSQRR